MTNKRLQFIGKNKNYFKLCIELILTRHWLKFK